MNTSRTLMRRFVPALLAWLAMTVPALAQFDAKASTEWLVESDTAHPGTTIHAAVRVMLKEHWHMHSDTPAEEDLIATVLSVTVPDGFTVNEIIYPEPSMLSAEMISSTPLSVFDGDLVIGVAIAVGTDVVPGTYEIGSSLYYQACDDKTCVAPDTQAATLSFQVVSADTAIERTENVRIQGIEFTGSTAVVTNGTTDGGTPAVTTPTDDCDVMLELEGFTILGTAGGYLPADEFLEFVANAETGTVKKGAFADKGPLAIIVIVIIGGVLLNLTPCVLPLIPINLAIIGAGAQAGSKSRGFLLGGTYGLAMALVYGILGLVAVLAGTAFGTINGTIWFNVGIAILFIVLALAMFDVFAIDFTKYGGKLDMTGKAKQGTFYLAFGMGAVAAVLAGACVAPVVIQVILYSADQYEKGTQIAVALPFCLGLGMALPWPFAGAGMSVLPKPGKWMNYVKKGMGVFILLFSAYYAYTAWEIYQSRSAGAGHTEEGWTASICEGLAEAEAEDKLVFIDMWATWCKNCKTMDLTTFKNEQVVVRLEDYVKIKYQAEDLAASPAREMLELFEGVGLPHYAILRPKGDTPEPAAP